MCTIFNIRLLSILVIIIKFICSLYCFSIGIYFTSNKPLLQGFGLTFYGYGITLIIFSLLSLLMILPLNYALKRHNRFILFVSTALDVVTAIYLLGVSAGIGTFTIPTFPKVLQLDCLLPTPLIYSPEDCSVYLNSDRTAGYRLFWEGYYSNLQDKGQLQVLFELESSPCCGFYAPFSCISDGRSFPKNYLTKGVSSNLLVDRVLCGTTSGYYPVQPQTGCSDFSDTTVQPPIVGGCLYDLGIGFCIDNPNYQFTRGCASTVEDYLIKQVVPHVYLLILSMIMCLITASLSCCMYIKRKETDIYPEIYGKPQVKIFYLIMTTITYHNCHHEIPYL
jgi:hypothetical protein